MIKHICKVCKKDFWVYPYRKNTAKYCSKKCFDKSKIGLIGPKATHWEGGPKKLFCLLCRKKFYVIFARKNSAKYCSLKCYNIIKKGMPSKKKGKTYPEISGKNSSFWKGGKIKNKDGYVLIYKPNHPFAHNNYVFEHRLVMEKILGRYLKLQERVHHKNDIRDDNRPENLDLFVNNSQHAKHHFPKGSKFGIHIKKTPNITLQFDT